MVQLRTFSILLFCILLYVQGSKIKSDFREGLAREFSEYRNETDLFWKEFSLEDVKSKQAEIMKDFIDSSVEPCENFFKYACGNGKKYTPFNTETGDKTSIFLQYGKFMFNSARAINLLNDQYKDIKDVNSAEGKLKTFYSSCINEKEYTEPISDRHLIFSYVPEIFRNKCFEVVEKNLHPLLGAFFIKNYFDRNSDEVINEISTELIKTLVSDINQAWIESDGKKAVLNYLNGVKVKSGIDLFSDEVFNEIYEDLNVTPNDYKANLINLEKFNSNRTLSEYSWTESSSSYYQGKEKQDILNLPIFQLQPPNFHRYFPKSLLYGSVGTEILHNLITSFPEFELRDKVKELGTCLENEKNSYGSEFDLFPNRDIGKSKTDRILTEYFSLQKSFNTYEKWLENSENSANEKLTGLDVNPKQLFFLSYAQNRCAWQYEKLNESRNKFLTNFEKFSEVYSCPIGSGMNPEKKCKLTS